MDRRTYLLLLSSTLAGCGGSQAGGSKSGTPTSTGPTGKSATVTTTPIDYSQQFRDRLLARSVDIDYLGNDGIRAQLDYYVGDVEKAAIQESVIQVATAFVEPVATGWSVEGLDATVLHPESNEQLTTYRIESIWTKQYHEETIDRVTYRRKILDTLQLDPTLFQTPSPIPSPTPQSVTPTEFELGAIDSVKENAFASIRIDYNYTLTETVDLDPTDDVNHKAESSMRFLAVQLRVKNQSDVRFSFYPETIDLRKRNGNILKYRKFADTRNPLYGAKLEPGAEIEGVIPYEIFHKVDAGDLVFDQSPYIGKVTCRFFRDRKLPVSI